MSIGTNLASVLPQKFLGVIPLYIGVEIILGVAIINKAGGVYGVLSLFTGHPINFWQWLFNVLAISTLPFYMQALIHLNNKPKNVRKMSLATVVYTIDTAVGVFYTLYFLHFWFSREDDSLSVEVGQRASEPKITGQLPNAPVDLSKQSASQTRELFISLGMTLAISLLRFYFNLVILSFTKALLKQNSSEQRYNDNIPKDDEEVELAMSTGHWASFKKYIMQWENESKNKLKEILLS